MAIRFLKSGAPYPSEAFLVALFDCVMSRPPENPSERSSTRRVLADRRAYDYILDLIETASATQGKINHARMTDLFEILEPVMGPFEINSQGTDEYLLTAEELRKRYDWDDDELQRQLSRISSHRFK